MDMAGVLHEGDGAVLSMFVAGLSYAAAVYAASQREAWWALVLAIVGAANLWVGLG